MNWKCMTAWVAAALVAALSLGCSPQWGEAYAQSSDRRPVSIFRPTGTRRPASESAAAFTLVGYNFQDKFDLVSVSVQTALGWKSENKREVNWISSQRIEAIARIVGQSLGRDPAKAVQAQLGEEGVNDLRRLIIATGEVASNQVIIPDDGPSSSGASVGLTTDKEGSEDPADWVTTIFPDFAGIRCTATLIGPRAMLTAAHCLESGGPFAIEVNERPIGLDCDIHPSYRPFGRGVLFDYALCHIDEDFPLEVLISPKVDEKHVLSVLDQVGQEGYIVPHKLREIRSHFRAAAPDGQSVLVRLTSSIHKIRLKTSERRQLIVKQVMIEQLEVEIARRIGAKRTAAGLKLKARTRFERLSLRRGDGSFRIRDQNARRVLLTGYGCIKRDETGGQDNRLRAGRGRISRYGRRWLQIGSLRRRDSAILCQGDSGGAAYRLLSDSAYGPRVIVAINAQNILRNARVQNVSFLAKTSSPGFIRFFRIWRRKWGFPAVCGVDRGINAICHK